jgi:glycosyltransferase involved in cell wall biosynthesis
MTPRLIIDLRCLQDEQYAERGIGNHARNLVAQAREPFIGIIDPAMPKLPDPIATRAARLSPHGYIPDLPPGAMFVNPSPMSPDQVFIARLLADPAITKAAVVYDFIPYDEPTRYLTNPLGRLDYFTAMAWLKRYDVFFPISRATDARLRGLYGEVTSRVTGVALPAWMEGVVPQPPSHILMIGGDDPRKNPEILLRAHAASDRLRPLKLIITGYYDVAAQARLRTISTAEFPGRIGNDVMRGLYARAYCVVVPSRAEGFSMPVIEAMASATPAIVSDIPPHQALVPDAAQRFAPDDATALQTILEAIIADPARRAAIIAAQSAGSRPFTGEAVATKIWGALRPAAPAIQRGAKPRIAMLSPMPPARSGVADYHAALAAALAPLSELSVFAATAIGPLPHLSPAYDRVVSAIGNSHLHADIYDLALRWGSAVICHDARLIGLVAGRGLDHAAELASRELRRAVAPETVALWAENENGREASFLGDLAACAKPLIFHAPQPVALVAARFGVAAHRLPFAMYRPFRGPVRAADRARARTTLGIAPEQKIIASFGFIGRNKGVLAALHGFARLRRTQRHAKLVFVGAPNDSLALFKNLSLNLGISEAVDFGAGFLAEADYRNYLLAADAALQLRESGEGNISGALQDCIAAGLPAVANDDLAENIAAPSYVTRVADRLDPAKIATALDTALQANRDFESERAAYCEAHSMDTYAKLLLETLGL